MVYGNYTERRILIYSRTTSHQQCTSRLNFGRSHLTPALITAQRSAACIKIIPDHLLAENAASIVSHRHATAVFERRYRLYGIYFQRYGEFFFRILYMHSSNTHTNAQLCDTSAKTCHNYPDYLFEYITEVNLY